LANGIWQLALCSILGLPKKGNKTSRDIPYSIMLWNFYLRNGTAYVPTVAQTEAGFYLDVEPVEVVPATDFQALQQAIKRSLNRGNPKVPTPSRASVVFII
jgi:hypothetical protein